MTDDQFKEFHTSLRSGNTFSMRNGAIRMLIESDNKYALLDPVYGKVTTSWYPCKAELLMIFKDRIGSNIQKPLD